MNEDFIRQIAGEVAIVMAKESQMTVKTMTLAQRNNIINNIRKETIKNAATLAKMAVDETGMGNVEHKIMKHHLTAEKTPGTEEINISTMSPFGIIGAITPSTNPSETIICNTIGMLAGGNTVVFSPHPGAKKTSLYAIDMINRASAATGGPEKIVFPVSTEVMLRHKDIHLIVATGGPSLVDTVLSSGKRGIGAGAGNPPVLVDETADLRKAAEDIINGCTFDNNLPCIAEKAIVAVDSIADKLMSFMINESCYQASETELDKIRNMIFTKQGLNRKCVGKSAEVLLDMIGSKPPHGTRCIVFKGNINDRLVSEELMMPILGMVITKDFEDALGAALKLEHNNRHSAHIHSKNIDRLLKYEKAMDTTIIVKNAPSYAALGFETDGFCTFTIASRTGEGLTSASTFVKKIYRNL